MNISVVRVHNTGDERKMWKRASKLLSWKATCFLGLKQLPAVADKCQNFAEKNFNTMSENKSERPKQKDSSIIYEENKELKPNNDQVEVVNGTGGNSASLEWIYLARFLDRVFLIAHLVVWVYHTFYTEYNR